MENEDVTIAELAVQFDVSDSTINRALAWGRRKGFFARSATDKLQEHIGELKAQIEWLESELKIAKKAQVTTDEKTGKRIKLPMAAHRIGMLSRELRETRALLMELEGVYKKTVALQVDESIVDVLNRVHKTRNE
jgi:transposase-like protein